MPKYEFINFKNYIPKLRYDVPDCPSCKSPMTGHFVKYHKHYSEWMIKDALQNGEIISLTSDEKDDNLFCSECGFTWYEPLPIKIHSLSYIEKERIRKHTGELLTAFEEEEKEKGKNNNSGIASKIIEFLK